MRLDGKLMVLRLKEIKVQLWRDRDRDRSSCYSVNLIVVPLDMAFVTLKRIIFCIVAELTEMFCKTSNKKVMPLLVASSLLPSFLAYSHPHSWISMQTFIQGDQRGITGLHMTWEFDAMTSTYMLDGEDLSDEYRDSTLYNLANEVLYNMKSFHYFSYFYSHGRPHRYKVAVDPVMQFERGKAELQFDLPFSEPIELTKGEHQLQVFDTSYFVEMSWMSDHSVTLSPDLQPFCSLQLKEPTPSAEDIAYALSLAIDGEPERELGSHFSQTLTIMCDSNE